VDVRNGRRVVRALESLEEAAGRTQTDELWNAGGRYAHRLVALDPGDDRAALNARIDRRVDEMLAAGALEEVAAARAAGPFSRTAAQAIGVRELCAVLDGELALPEAAARMKSRTRALARRQLTWMRKLPDAVRVAASGRPPAAVAADVLRLVRGGSW
jgi:tRNA dimethylallyltransferase